MRNLNKVKPVAGARIQKSLEEAIGFAQGLPSEAKVHTINLPLPNVRNIRRQLRLTQTAFALKFGLPAATVRNWEQGRTLPDAPARVLLAVIARHPESVSEALQSVEP